jgi:hypothetical protein
MEQSMAKGEHAMTKWILIGLLASGTALADEQLEKRKKDLLSELDQEITLIQQLKKCLQGAKDGEAIRVCHEPRRVFGDRRRARMAQMEQQGPMGGPGMERRQGNKQGGQKKKNNNKRQRGN